MPYDLTQLSPFLLYHIIEAPQTITSQTIIRVKCECGSEKNINFRSFWRKWRGKDHYLCKSCHVKTYASDITKIAKFKKSFAITARTPEHKQKCSISGKKAWIDPTTRQRIIKAIQYDNKINPKKKKARAIALAALKQKSWFRQHMNAMRLLAIQKTKSSTDEFISKAVLIHDNFYNYSSVSYINGNTQIEIICPKHGSFYQTPHSHLQGKGCQKCATTISTEHQYLIDLLPSNIIIENNIRSIIPPLELDIWIPDYSLGIEINGEYWHGAKSTNTKIERQRLKNLHSHKATYAEQSGIKLLQFWADEITAQQQLVKSMIYHAIGRSTRIHARKCTTNIIDNANMSDFMNVSHIQGHRNASVNYILTLNNEIVCGLSLSKHPIYEWEIIRFANKTGHVVVGGFTKLLARFINDYQPKLLLTFADRRFSQGNLYRNFFTLIDITKPNYFYYHRGKKLSRQQCQKHKLKNRLGDCFDPLKSEVQNMLDAGYVQIYDAGHLKFTWKQK